MLQSMTLQKHVSTLFGTMIIMVIAISALCGVFVYRYTSVEKLAKITTVQTDINMGNVKNAGQK